MVSVGRRGVYAGASEATKAAPIRAPRARTGAQGSCALAPSLGGPGTHRHLSRDTEVGDGDARASVGGGVAHAPLQSPRRPRQAFEIAMASIGRSPAAISAETLRGRVGFFPGARATDSCRRSGRRWTRTSSSSGAARGELTRPVPSLGSSDFQRPVSTTPRKAILLA